jgi:hypothetical protein
MLTAPDLERLALTRAPLSSINADYESAPEETLASKDRDDSNQAVLCGWITP